MTNTLREQLAALGQKIIGYLPNLLGGLLLLLLGWLAGWIVKRVIIQLLVVLRIDRLFLRLRWRSSLSKADLRYALYNLIGNVAFFVVFLIFLDSALTALRLEVLSRLIEQGVLFVPRLIVALIVLGAGWLVAARTRDAVFRALVKENVARASLIARIVKFVLVLFFAAMALVELNIANQVVLVGFGAIVLTLGLSIVLAVAGGGDSFKDFFRRDEDSPRRLRRGEGRIVKRRPDRGRQGS
jgi:hypothetical protein